MSTYADKRNLRLRTWAYLFVSIVIGAYIMRLYFTDKLSLYIHPKYELFALVMSIIAIVLISAAAWYQYRQKTKPMVDTPKFGIPEFCLGVLLILALVIPSQSLSSDTLKKRSLRTPLYGSFLQSEGNCPTIPSESIPQLVKLISSTPLRCFDGKTFTLTGYVLHPEPTTLPDNFFYITQTVVSCCVVDASPYGLPVRVDDDQTIPAEDQWLILEAKFAIETVNNEAILVSQPTRITPTNNPAKPYEFYSKQAGTPLPTLEPASN